MTIEIIEEVMPGTSVIEEIVNLQLSVIEGDTAAAEAAAAAAAASAASASSSASTATTQAGIATTKAQEADASATAAETARTGAETAETNAETAQAAAEAARDEITGKVDFTGIQVGDLLQAVDVSGVVKLVRVTPVDLLKSTGPFLKSPLAGMVDLDNVFAWDGFNRPDGPIGVADSGQTWQNLGLIDQFTISNNSATRVTATNILTMNYIDRITYGSSDLFGNQGSCRLSGNFYDSGIGTIGVGLVFIKDENNYFYVVFAGSVIGITVVISGVSTSVTNISKISGGIRSKGSLSVNFNRRSFDNAIDLHIDSSVLSSRTSVSLTPYYSTFGTNFNDISKVGIISGTGTSRRSVHLFMAENTTGL